MAAQHSAGILMHRGEGIDTEVFLVHPGGPFWAKKDAGAWSIPKGIFDASEEVLTAARREFQEETGFPVVGEFRELGEFKQPSGKIIHVWTVEGDCDPGRLVSNQFEMEWPPKSGKIGKFPEVDRAAWFGGHDALKMILPGQQAIVRRFFESLGIVLVDSASAQQRNGTLEKSQSSQGNLF